MQPFTRLAGIAASLQIDNVDTDAIIPSKETQSVSRTGYGEKLFANWRYLPGGRQPNPLFVLNQPPFDHASILVSGRYFGCGSSREAAVWALAQFGIRAVIAESFGAIFRNNCIRNGVLPVALSHDDLGQLHENLRSTPGLPVVVDLHKQLVEIPQSAAWAFDIGSLDRESLLLGLDEIAMTLNRRSQIEQFRDKDRNDRPWLYADRPK
jgi:3-isopropylmalate/(R)-2-methylmalate dehydratase small subunit